MDTDHFLPGAGGAGNRILPAGLRSEYRSGFQHIYREQQHSGGAGLSGNGDSAGLLFCDPEAVSTFEYRLEYRGFRVNPGRDNRQSD